MKLLPQFLPYLCCFLSCLSATHNHQAATTPSVADTFQNTALPLLTARQPDLPAVTNPGTQSSARPSQR